MPPASDVLTETSTTTETVDTSTNTVPEWMNGADPELIEYANKRGPEFAKDPKNVLKSYRELEQKATWHDAVRIPKKAEDAAGWEKAYKTWGRPDAPEGYELPGEGEPIKAAAALFHGAGLSKAQAQKVAAGWQEFQEAETKAAAEVTQTRILAEQGELAAEWGGLATQNMEIAKRGYVALGLTKEQVDEIETTVGHKAVMMIAFKAGQLVSEDGGTGTNAGGANSPSSAQAAINAIATDPVQMEMLRKGDPALNARWEALHKLAYGS